jgi:hypothetical protein
VQENNMNEIRRFNKERRQDLVEMFKGFVSEQVGILSFNMFFPSALLFAVCINLLNYLVKIKGRIIS